MAITYHYLHYVSVDILDINTVHYMFCYIFQEVIYKNNYKI
jgi:hypothetical protein